MGAAAVLSGGTRIFVHLLQGLSLPLLSVLRLLNTQDKLQVLWRLGHSSAKPAFWNFCKRIASGDLAGKITHKFAKLSCNLKNTGNCWVAQKSTKTSGAKCYIWTFLHVEITSSQEHIKKKISLNMAVKKNYRKPSGFASAALQNWWI